LVLLLVLLFSWWRVSTTKSASINPFLLLLPLLLP
jgi:hypothetical protein